MVGVSINVSLNPGAFLNIIMLGHLLVCAAVVCVNLRVFVCLVPGP